MRSEERAGGYDPQHQILNQLNNHSNLCKKCEAALGDRKYSPKSEPVKMAGSLFVTEEGGN
jgi:hypothetical protein